MKLKYLSLVVALTGLAACSSTEPPPRVAQDKKVAVEGVELTFGGSFDERKNLLVLKVNGDPIMQGSFPPYTPTQNLSAKYKDMNIKGNCYFGSVLGRQGGAFGAIAGAIQSSKNSTADKCELLVDGKQVEQLYF
ncbi:MULTISPECIES: hypothetical protein [Shewanella]|uniref:hypothetical protein n=1 Tax=Shewanella TaxID=22 RepID=UPI001C65688C|nr:MULTISPECIES: hypothetical protein [Shewanella]QYJ76088.1 hypothetical protein K0H79_03625 [Shewanella sp. FJAT-52076]QYK06006.1 hypothetical protein K0H63_03960 [Shewanella zhangzhouensis]